MISISSLVFALALSSIGTFAAPGPGLSVSVPKSVDGVENFKVQTAVTNTGNETFSLLKDPNTIPTDHNTEAFSISPPDELSTIQAEAGQPTRLSTSGTLASNKSEESHPQTLNTGAVTHSRHFSKRAITFVGCTQPQVLSILQAASDAADLVTQSANYLQGITAATPRWTTWFGTYSDADRQQILAYFTHISAANAPLRTQYRCNCNVQNSPADVDVNIPGRVDLCPGFFAAPATGTNSKAGIIVWANTRFTDYGGATLFPNTNTQATCMALAAHNHFAAIISAYNLQYFAENTPALM